MTSTQEGEVTEQRGGAGAPRGLLVGEGGMGLATDLYQLTMMAAYHVWEMEEEATFELFVRRLPSGRAYLVAAGLEQCLHYLEGAHFSGEDIDYLKGLEAFRQVPAGFFERLRAWRFGGSVWAMEEGTVAFGGEPLVQVQGSLFEAQLVETYLLSVINFQTSVASKAARVVTAAQGRACIDFGTRRAHGPQAGVYAARAAYVGGLVGTSNVYAAKACGIPPVGTAAHAFTMACPSEEEAFARYEAVFPTHTTLLIDTYDTLEGARRAAAIKGALKGVRIDSGDLVALSKQVRAILDGAGRGDAQVTVSGDLNEDKIAAMLEAGAAVDRFGVGTELVTSRDHPALGGVYKLVSRLEGGERKDVMKLAEGKITYPGAKQVWRQRDADGTFCGDVMRLAESGPPPGGGEPLLVPVVEAGQRVYQCPTLDAVQARCRAQVAALPASLRQLKGFGAYPVTYDADILALVARLQGAT
jgi:nicotinate phosphoribosyltransferase